MTVLQGDLASRRFVASYSHHGTVVGALGWNSPRELRALRQLVVDRAPSSPVPVCARFDHQGQLTASHHTQMETSAS